IGTPALTTRGFGAAEFDQVAELIVNVLTQTQPTATKDGLPGKAKYTIADGVANRTKDAAAELMGSFPLYPGLVL
ncbi:MAG: glycine hydroxymethyltransferase, partial [Propionibacteriaceae bacterium]|nr:glycine hydroxymethyltransferase [Propionibacteriaceae bacterium]